MSDAFRDQAHAAERERDEILELVGIQHRFESGVADGKIEAAAKDKFSRWRAAKSPRCVHIEGVQPMFMEMFIEPPVALCLVCQAAIHLVLEGSEEADVCDICRKKSPALMPFSINRGPLSITGGICGECWGPGWERLPHRD
jgi:hypothetical protein